MNTLRFRPRAYAQALLYYGAMVVCMMSAFWIFDATQTSTEIHTQRLFLSYVASFGLVQFMYAVRMFFASRKDETFKTRFVLAHQVSYLLAGIVLGLVVYVCQAMYGHAIPQAKSSALVRTLASGLAIYLCVQMYFRAPLVWFGEHKDKEDLDHE